MIGHQHHFARLGAVEIVGSTWRAAALVALEWAVATPALVAIAGGLDRNGVATRTEPLAAGAAP